MVLEQMDFSQFLVLLIAQGLIGTYLLKKFFKQQTFLIASLFRIKDKKVLGLFDLFSKRHRLLDIFSEIGLVLGFGAVAVDYLYGREFGKKHGKLSRWFLFLVSLVLIGFVFYFIDFALGNFISKGPFTGNLFWVFLFFFGLGGFAGFSIMALAVQALDIIFKFLVGIKGCPGVAPLLPGVSIPNVTIYVPLHGWLSLFIILVLHEGMHGVVARRHGFKIKSTGLLLVGFLPFGAFVEPDEKQVAKANPRKALHLFAAGATANLAALVFIQIFVLIVASFLAIFINPWAINIHQNSVDGIIIGEVKDKSTLCGEEYLNPAFGQLEEGMEIKKINNNEILTAGAVTAEIAKKRYQPVKFTLLTKEGKEIEKTLSPNELGLFGFSVVEEKRKDFEFPQAYNFYVLFVSIFESFFSWLFILNLLVAIVNFMPLAVFDGGRIAKLLFLPYFGFMKMPKKDTEKLIGRLFLWIILPLILINALPLFL